MRLSFALVLLLPSASFAQTVETEKAVQRELATKRTAKWVLECEVPGGGFYPAPPDPKADPKPNPGLSATSAAVRSLKYLGFPLMKGERERHAAFVLSCYDPKTGSFAEPGGKPGVAVTSVGVMAAVELGVPKEKFAKAMDYLKENAKSFEEVRIGAAAVEAWGVKDCPFDLKEWRQIGEQHPKVNKATAEALKDGEARMWGSLVAFNVRLGLVEPEKYVVGHLMALGQRGDGGWGKEGEKASDIETTYRVMRALYLLKGNKPDGNKPDLLAVRKFVESHRNDDSGYATAPGGKSSVSGVYYCTIVTKWLDDMDAAKK